MIASVKDLPDIPDDLQSISSQLPSLPSTVISNVSGTSNTSQEKRGRKAVYPPLSRTPSPLKSVQSRDSSIFSASLGPSPRKKLDVYVRPDDVNLSDKYQLPVPLEIKFPDKLSKQNRKRQSDTFILTGDGYQAVESVNPTLSPGISRDSSLERKLPKSPLLSKAECLHPEKVTAVRDPSPLRHQTRLDSGQSAHSKASSQGNSMSGEQQSARKTPSRRGHQSELSQSDRISLRNNIFTDDNDENSLSQIEATRTPSARNIDESSLASITFHSVNNSMAHSKSPSKSDIESRQSLRDDIFQQPNIQHEDPSCMGSTNMGDENYTIESDQADKQVNILMDLSGKEDTISLVSSPSLNTNGSIIRRRIANGKVVDVILVDDEPSSLARGDSTISDHELNRIYSLYYNGGRNFSNKQPTLRSVSNASARSELSFVPGDETEILQKRTVSGLNRVTYSDFGSDTDLLHQSATYHCLDDDTDTSIITNINETAIPNNEMEDEDKEVNFLADDLSALGSALKDNDYKPQFNLPYLVFPKDKVNSTVLKTTKIRTPYQPQYQPPVVRQDENFSFEAANTNFHTWKHQEK
ncbi:hypothetical protein LJB42_002512 [Komagataella kurtzmanii]|nr:hypothetical protein LJB42_002512 [Komagataella kurtzmanii]